MRILTGFLTASLAISAIATPARADIRLNQGSNGTYSIPVMSWRDIPFRSVVRQQFAFDCGAAAVATMLSYHYGRRTPEQQVFAAMWEKGNRDLIRKAGFSMLDMKQYLDGVGYRTEGFRLTIDTLRKTERPGIVLLDLKGYKHFVVVKGVFGDRVLVGDSMLGLGTYAIEDFAKMWNGIYLAVVQTPQNQKPLFNLAADWGPWSPRPTGPADLTAQTPVSNFTQGMGDVYQLLPDVIQVNPRDLVNP